MENITFKLGLYEQTNILAFDEEDANVFGIAICAFEGEESYAVATVNLPSRLGDFCEMIGVKNAAYMDINNSEPILNKLLEMGVAKDTGYTKICGFVEYPLYLFDEEWLKSLEPVQSDRTWDTYSEKYEKAMDCEF